MNESKISVRYAKALFGLTKETGSMDALKSDVEVLYQCIQEIPELQFVIQSPVIRSGEKTRLFKEMFRNSFNPLTLTFINLVLDKHREEYLVGISRYFLDLIKTEQGIQSAGMVTAIPLDESLRRSVLSLIAKKFKVRQVELNETVDARLIGGYMLRVGDQQLDASIATKLKRIHIGLNNPHS
jgi:F-type H+-transporting ATPase subunit delta